MDKQTKNITKLVVFVLLGLLLGDGVFGLALFWPFLLLLVDWKYLYWFALWLGLCLSVLKGVDIGWPSLYLVLTCGVWEVFLSEKRQSGLYLLVFSLLFSAGLHFIIGEEFGLIEACLLAVMVFLSVTFKGGSDAIRVSYR